MERHKNQPLFTEKRQSFQLFERVFPFRLSVYVKQSEATGTTSCAGGFIFQYIVPDTGVSLRSANTSSSF